MVHRHAVGTDHAHYASLIARTTLCSGVLYLGSAIGHRPRPFAMLWELRSCAIPTSKNHGRMPRDGI